MIKLLFVVMLVAALSFGADDGCTDSSVGIDPGTSGSDDITLTVINDWTLAGGTKALGLDVFEGTEVYILGADNTNMHIQAYSTSGTPVGTLDLSAANASCFGVAWNDNTDTEGYYTDDWADAVLYYTEDFGSTWTTVTNPASNQARGMAFDGVDYWETNGNGGGLWRFQPGVGEENIAIPEVPTQPSGVAVFPYGGNLGVAVTAYNTLNIYFYEWDGSTMSFLGSAACPGTVGSSFGLAYSSSNGHMYWSYSDGSNNHLAELSFTITALERSSWGSIKTSF
ncbi:MAG: hypothetical protein U9P42_08715 [Candidatus Fermentibacteria bacterium]|nr:hypothetical protein [Candidatus Fermentibacteria bacterium]